MKFTTLVFALLALFSGTVIADEAITLVAAPRGDVVAETALYAPIAQYLSEATGRRVEYKYIEDWLSYRMAVKNNMYDLYFDGPHFVGWRMDFKGHHLLARLTESHTFVVIARNENARVEKISNLSGRGACLHASPNLGTEIFINSFTNAARQPYTVLISGWKSAYEGVLTGKCDGAVIPDKVLAKLDTEKKVKVVHTFQPIANQAFTASDKLPAPLVAVLRSAMLAPKFNEAGKALLSTYASKGFTAADPKDYIGASLFLKFDFALGQEVERATKPTVAASR